MTHGDISVRDPTNVIDMNMEILNGKAYLWSSVIGAFFTDVNLGRTGTDVQNVNITSTSAYQIGQVEKLNATKLNGNMTFSGLTGTIAVTSQLPNQAVNTTSDVTFNSVNSSTDYKIGGTEVLSASTLGVNVNTTNISLNNLSLTNTGDLNISSGSYYKINGNNVLHIVGTGGSENVFVGNAGNNGGTGFYNFGMGGSCLTSVSSGSENTGIGFATLNQITSGQRNVAIGTNSGYQYTTSETNNLCLGYNVQGSIGDNNKVRIGDSSIDHNFFYGDLEIQNAGDKFKINGSEKVSATQLNAQNNYPSGSGQLAIIGNLNYIYLSQNSSASNSTAIVTGSDTLLQLINQGNTYTNTSNNFSLQTQGSSPVYITGVTNSDASALYKYTVTFSASMSSVPQFVFFRVYQNSTPVTLTGAYIPTTTYGLVTVSFIGTLANNETFYLYGKCNTTSDTIALLGTQIICELVSSRNS